MASTPSAIALFPFQQDFQDNCLQRTLTVTDTLLSAMRAYIVTRRGSRLGNMVGCFLPDLIYTLVGTSDLSGYSNQLKSDLGDQFPGVTFLNVYMSLNLSNRTADLDVSIKFSSPWTGIQQLDVILPTQIAINLPSGNA